MREMLSVRQWQDLFRSGAFQDRSRETQIRAGWYDWFCADSALAGRLQRIGRVVMGITEPAILDNYYVWFKNNCPLDGPSMMTCALSRWRETAADGTLWCLRTALMKSRNGRCIRSAAVFRNQSLGVKASVKCRDI